MSARRTVTTMLVVGVMKAKVLENIPQRNIPQIGGHPPRCRSVWHRGSVEGTIDRNEMIRSLPFFINDPP